MALVGYQCRVQRELEPSTSSGKRNRCFLCPRSKERKVIQKCSNGSALQKFSDHCVYKKNVLMNLTFP